jgi:hypothetical protein
MTDLAVMKEQRTRIKDKKVEKYPTLSPLVFSE